MTNPMDGLKIIESLRPTDLNCNIFSVYDFDGRSMQELLCQFFNKINECVEISNATFKLAEWLVNEGLAIEVAKKLEAWLADGTLEGLLDEMLLKKLNETIAGKVDKKNSSTCVEDFGAKGDGVTDDSDAIIDCLSKNRKVHFVQGKTYVITKHIKFNENNWVDGSDCTILYKAADACIEVNRGIMLENFNLKVDTNLTLSKSVILIDGNVGYDVGFRNTPSIRNIKGEEVYNDNTKRNTFIHFKAEQSNGFNRCYISGVNIENIKAIRFKFGIKLTTSEVSGTSHKTYITSNVIDNFQSFNCENFIYEYQPIGSKTSMGANTYSNCHFQPSDGGMHIYLNNWGNGNIIRDCNFWDNTRCSNKDQIRIYSNNNVITGGELPPYDSEYWVINGSYNFIQGHTFGTPSYAIPVVVSDRNIYRLFNNSKKTVPFIHGTKSSKIKSTTDDTSIDNVTLDISYLKEGHNVVKFKSYGAGTGGSENFAFKIKVNNTDHVISNITNDFSNSYKVDAIVDIRKYPDRCDIVTVLEVHTNSGKFYVHTGEKTVQNSENEIALNFTFKSTSTNYFTNLYSEIEMIAQ